MSSLADKNLSKGAQDKISNITSQAQSGKISWSEANKQANAVRASEGANYTVSAGGTTSYKDGSSISSYKTGSHVSGGGAAQQTVSKYGGSSSSRGSSSGNRVTNLPGNAQPAQATQTPLAPAQPPALNQYGFRDNFDYTQALQDTNLTPEQRAQYIQERQNKIYTNYGGVEPNMTGSGQKFSQTAAGRGSGVTNTYRGIEYTRAPNTGMYGAPVLNSEVKNYTQNGVTYQTGPSMARVWDPNIIKNGYYISNGYTVFVDQDGYATKAVKGVADYTPHQDINAANGTYGKNGAWTDLEMMGDKEGSDYYEIQKIRAQLQAGQITGDEANAAANAIRAKYGYSIDKNGYVTDYGALTAVNDRRQQMGLATNAENGSAAYYRYLMNTDTSPAAQAAGQVKTYQQFAQENGYDVSAPTGVNGKVPTVQTVPLPGNSVIGGSGSAGGGTSGSGNLDMSPGTSDVYTPGNMGNYLDQWYQNAQQQQQNTIDFGTNQAILELLRTKQDAEAQYQEQRNQIAIDEAKAKDNQALYAEQRGDKGGIGAAQYDAIMNTAAQNRLQVNSAQTKLATDTSRQIADLRAQGEYEKADALLTLSQQYLSQLMSLEQWAAEYNLSVAQFNASLKQWQAEFDLKVADLLGSYNGMPTLSAKEFAFNQQQYQDSLKADQEKKLASAGEILLDAGIPPSPSQLAAMGMTRDEADAYILAKKVEAAAKGKSGNGGGDGTPTEEKPRLTAAQAQSAMNDENFTTSTLSAYDYYYGEGSALSALMNSNEWVAKLVRNLSTIKDENNGKARKYASLKQYYEKGYFNEAAYAYLLDYFGVA